MGEQVNHTDTGRSVALVCMLAGVVLVIAINPRGVYDPWELTFALCVLFLCGSAAAFLYFHLRLISNGPSRTRDQVRPTE